VSFWFDVAETRAFDFLSGFSNVGSGELANMDSALASIVCAPR
jgi:hypothetical protein